MNTHKTSDEGLIRRLSRGRDEALGTLYLRYAPRLLLFAAQSLDRTTAEDIVQEAFLSVWRHAGTFDPARGAFRPWVFQILRRQIFNELRRRGRRPRVETGLDTSRVANLPDAGPEPLEVVWRNAIRSTVRGALDDLPDAQRCAMNLAFLSGMTHEQVAVELNVPLGTVKARIRSGLRKLRGRLTPLDGHAPETSHPDKTAAPRLVERTDVSQSAPCAAVYQHV